MRLTSKGRYAVMAMADLAAHQVGDRAVPLQDIALRQAISLSYLEQLFARLRRGGLVEGVRGPGGGYRLARPAAGIFTAEIIAAVDETIAVVRCQPKAKLGCTGKSERCIAHDLWEAMGEHIHEFLAQVSLQDVVERKVRVSPGYVQGSFQGLPQSAAS